MRRFPSTLTLALVLVALSAASAHAQSHRTPPAQLAGQGQDSPAGSPARETIGGGARDGNLEGTRPGPPAQAIRKSCVCTQQYDPVICDGAVYSNACFASCAGARNCSPRGSR